MEKRIVWLDWAKAIGIWLVVLGHLPFQGHSVLFYFHMPFFFILSGFLYKPIPLKDEIRKSAKRLLLPYCVYNAILLSLLLLTGDRSYWNAINMLLGNQNQLPINCCAMWFLVALFVIRCLYSLVRYVNSWVIILGCVVLFCLSLYLNPAPVANDYLQLQTSLLCAPFFEFGYLANKQQLIMRMGGVKICKLILVVSMLVIGFLVAWWNGYTDTDDLTVNVFRCLYGRSLLLFYLSATAISLALMILMSWFLTKRNRFVDDIAAETILIMALHQTVIVSLIKYVPKNPLVCLLFSILIMTFFWGVIQVKHCSLWLKKKVS